jgi:hypothetical protein
MRDILYKEFSPNRRFGVELEVSNNLSKQDIGDIVNEYEILYSKKKKIVKITPGLEGWAQTKNNAYWHVKFDRTCGPLGKDFDNGWEIASYIGCGVKDVDHIARLARFLHAAGVETNTNCGLHIHVETFDFNEESMGVLLARWLKVENFLTSICHFSRHNNQYCAPVRHKIFGWQNWYDYKKPSTLWHGISPSNLSVHNNFEKRFTLNTVGFAIGILNPLYNRNTVELRLPECILDERHVKNWTRLIVQFVEASKNSLRAPEDLDSCQSLEEILLYLGLYGGEDFLILSPELLNTKLWFLNKIICFSNNKKIIKQAKKYLQFITTI